MMRYVQVRINRVQSQKKAVFKLVRNDARGTLVFYAFNLLKITRQPDKKKRKILTNDPPNSFSHFFFFFNPKISKLTKNGIKVVENYVKSKNKYRSG